MDAEKYFSTRDINGKVQRAIATETAGALRKFCEQSREFAQAVEQSDKSFQQCLDHVEETIHRRQSVSDFEAFRAAAEFYFPGAEIHFDMRIDLGEDDSPVVVAFESLLDF